MPPNPPINRVPSTSCRAFAHPAVHPVALIVAAIAVARRFVKAGGLACGSYVALVLLGYAAVLAIEFAWLRMSYADDPTMPGRRFAQLVRAWTREVHAPRVFLWRQPFRSASEPDHLPATAQGRRGVLLIHGFFCNRGLWNRWLRRLRRLDIPFIAVSLEPVFGSIDDYRLTIAAAIARLSRRPASRP